MAPPTTTATTNTTTAGSAIFHSRHGTSGLLALLRIGLMRIVEHEAELIQFDLVQLEHLVERRFAVVVGVRVDVGPFHLVVPGLALLLPGELRLLLRSRLDAPASGVHVWLPRMRRRSRVCVPEPPASLASLRPGRGNGPVA